MSDKKIEDFGDKIEGARKDMAALKKGLIDLTEAVIDGWSHKEQEQYISKDLVWKRPNYQDMVDSGLEKGVAYFIKTIRDALPTRPPDMSEEGIKGYVAFVQYVQEAVKDVKTYEDIPDFKDKLQKKYLTHTGFRYYSAKSEAYGCFQNRLLRALFQSKSNLEKAAYAKEFCFSEEEYLKKTYIQAIFSPSQYDSFKLQPHVYRKDTDQEYGYLTICAQTKPEPLTRLSRTVIITIQSDHHKCPEMTESDFEQDKYYVVNKNNELVFSGINSLEEAKKLALEYAKNADQTKTPAQKKTNAHSRKEKLLPPQLVHVRREGAPHRENNLDVTGEDILEAFKLRGGQFGNWTNQNDRQTNMNMLFDAFRDLAVALDIPYEDISLMRNNGERTAALGIAWGARGHSGAMAHYEPVENVINLTKMRGAGSLAHEWGHALDCYIKDMCDFRAGYEAEKAQKYMASHCINKDNPILRVIEAMEYKHIEGEERPVFTDYYKEAKKTDKEYAKTDNGYWSSSCEMFARAFACYVSDKLAEKGIKSDYLTGHSESTVYPHGEERKAIDKAFDEFFADLKERGLLRHQEHDIQAEEKKKAVTKFFSAENYEPVSIYENGEQMSFFDMTEETFEQSEPEPEPKETETFVADRQYPSSLDLPNWKVEYTHCSAPDTVRAFNTKTVWEVTPWSIGEKTNCEEMGIRELQRFRDKAIEGTILQYKVVEGDCSDFMKPWTADELGTELEENSGEADICRCTIYNDTEQKITCTVKVQDMGDELLQIMTNIIKSDKDENGIWQKTYDKNYYCESEELKNISIEDFVLLSYRDYGEFINDAVYFAESGKEQLYSPPRNAGNYKVFNDKKATEYLYK